MQLMSRREAPGGAICENNHYIIYHLPPYTLQMKNEIEEPE